MPRRSVGERVLTDTLIMEEMMPALMKRIPGKWIVFRDGKMRSWHRSIEAAFAAALKKYGLHGAFIISRVEPVKPKIITGTRIATNPKRARATINEEPSAESLREMPEVDLSRAKRDPTRFAIPMAKSGITLQVGRGRPAARDEVGGTLTRSVRFPASVWNEIERAATQEGLSVHAALRIAIARWARGSSRRASSRRPRNQA